MEQKLHQTPHDTVSSEQLSLIPVLSRSSSFLVPAHSPSNVTQGTWGQYIWHYSAGQAAATPPRQGAGGHCSDLWQGVHLASGALCWALGVHWPFAKPTYAYSVRSQEWSPSRVLGEIVGFWAS